MPGACACAYPSLLHVPARWPGVVQSERGQLIDVVTVQLAEAVRRAQDDKVPAQKSRSHHKFAYVTKSIFYYYLVF